MEAKKDDIIRIIRMDDSNGKDKSAAQYGGRIGLVIHIDDAGQLHGSWGGLALIPDKDKYEILSAQDAIKAICQGENIDDVKDFLKHKFNAEVTMVEDRKDDCCWLAENKYVMVRYYDLTIGSKTLNCRFYYADYTKKVEKISIAES